MAAPPILGAKRMSLAKQQDTFGERLRANALAVEAALDELLGATPKPGEIARPQRLLAAMRYAALGGGKRLRPMLVIETARLLGVEGTGPLRAAAAVEMLHCYSLAHDDLPAMDNDDLRRGRPTVHKAYDEATAVLVGDALLTLAFDTLADPATHPDAAIRAGLVLGLARAAGLGGMAGGQALDLEAESSASALDAGAIERLQAMKTGALLRFAVDAGANLGGADETQRSALVAYGRALGAAFQVADDILDAEGDAIAMGKRAGKDAGRNKATLVRLAGIEAARQRRDALVVAAQTALRGVSFKGNADMLLQTAAFAAARSV